MNSVRADNWPAELVIINTNEQLILLDLLNFIETWQNEISEFFYLYMKRLDVQYDLPNIFLYF